LALLFYELLEQMNLINRVLFLTTTSQDLLNMSKEALRGLISPSVFSEARFNMLLQQKNLLEQFKRRETNKLIILYLSSGAHYITVLVEQTPRPENQNFLSFTVYDSLRVNYLEEHIIHNQIQKLYEYLTQ